MKSTPWWKESVIYQIYPRSFFDSNGDGEGDLLGITSKLSYVADLGVDAIWLSPFYRSPNKDGGYDIANPRDVDPRFGELSDVKELIERANELGLKVLVDVVPNHFSDQHQWFQDALKAGSGSKERSRFHFYDAKSDGAPPNNWISLFGGPSWTQVEDGQYYLHLFDSSQPDLNWENADIAEDFEKTLRFWLDLGADGFRIDVAHGLVKEDILKDHHNPQGLSDALRLDIEMDNNVRNELLATVPFFDRDGVHEIYRSWRRLFDSYDREVMAVAEAWVHPPINATRYVRPDELHQVFNFDLLVAPFDAKELFACIDQTLQLISTVNTSPTWALSNHDTPRVASRLGENEARALALFVFALPGSCYVFSGQELGLPDAELADSDRQDPAFFRTAGVQKGRDGARVPLPWAGEATPFGFTTGKPWLPIPQEWRELTVENQIENISSSHTLYKLAIKLRAEFLVNSGNLEWKIRAEDGVLAFTRGEITVFLNSSSEEKTLPTTGTLLIASSAAVVVNGETISMAPSSSAWVLAKLN